MHTLALAEALQAAGVPVHVVALGDRLAGSSAAGPVPVCPHRLAAATLEQRVVG